MPLAFRGRWPFLILAATTVPVVVLNVLDYSAGLGDLAAMVLLYTVADAAGLALSVLAAVLVMTGYPAGRCPAIRSSSGPITRSSWSSRRWCG